MNEKIGKITDGTPEPYSLEFRFETGEEVPQKKIKKLWKEFFGKAPLPAKPIKVITLERREYLRFMNRYMKLTNLYKELHPEKAAWIDFADLLEYGGPQDNLDSRCMGICFNFDSEYAILIDRESPDGFRKILKHELAHIKNKDWEKDEAAWDGLKKAA